MPDQSPLPIHEMLEEEYVSLHGVLPDEHYSSNKTPEERLRAIYDRIHALETKRAALCISGGGIRSATFAVGVISGLARLRLLDKFDFLSTVSGGGYVGSWLSAWIHRDPKGPQGVFRELKDRPKSAMEPEPRPVRHLRAYSNYMSPSLGLLSADTWTLAATVGRNLVLNWTVFFPLLAAVLLIPRFCVSFVRLNLPEASKDSFLTPLLILAFVAGIVGVAYMSIFRPSLNRYREAAYRSAASQAGFLKWCLVPTLLMAVFLSTYWAWLRNSDISIEQQVSPIFKLPIEYPWPFFLFGLSLHLGAWLVFTLWQRRFELRELLVAVGVGFTGGVLLWIAAAKIFPKPVYDDDASIPSTELFVCFALPLIIALLLLTVTLFVGLASRFTEDEDREWLARFGAWGLIAILGWSAVSSLVIFGPEALMRLGAAAKVAVASMGGISGVIVAVLGRSAKTSANKKEASEGEQSPVTRIALALAAPVFVLIFLVALSLGTSALIVALAPRLVVKLPAINWQVSAVPSMLAGELDHLKVVHNSSLQILILLLASLLLVGLGMALFININKFSLHSMYRNRLIRAYLGASRLKRRENPFTGFDPDDNIQMHELRPERLHAGSFTNPSSLTSKLDDASNLISQYLQRRIEEIRESKSLRAPEDGGPDWIGFLTLALNEILDGECIHDSARFAGVSLDQETVTLLKQEPSGNRLAVLNRLLLEQAYAGEIVSFRTYKPLHVVNMALNLVAGKNLAWQQRKAESFTSSPLHSGCYCISDPEQDACGSRSPCCLAVGCARDGQ